MNRQQVVAKLEESYQDCSYNLNKETWVHKLSTGYTVETLYSIFVITSDARYGKLTKDNLSWDTAYQNLQTTIFDPLPDTK